METTINDLILVYIDGAPVFFGRIEDITEDIKPGWWQVHIMILAVPPRMISWILEESQINGKDFTMGGTPVRIEKVKSPYKEDEEIEDITEAHNIISLNEKKEMEEKDNIISMEGNKETEEKKQEPQAEGKGKIISLMDRIKK